MINFFEFSKWKIRPVVYSLSITVGLFSIILLLENGFTDLFISGAVLLYLLISFEQYITANRYRIDKKRNSDKVYDLEEHQYAQYLHHLAIPTMLYVFIVSFIYFHQEPSIYFLILLITFVIFSVLFENLHSFYRHSFALLKSTNYIYDVLTIILIFFITGTIQVAIIADWTGVLIGSFVFFILIFFNLFLFCVRHFLTFQALVLSGLFALFIGIFFLFFILSSLTSLLNAGIITVSFTIFLHAMNNYHTDGISKDELIEYLILVLLISALIYLNVS